MRKNMPEFSNSGTPSSYRGAGLWKAAALGALFISILALFPGCAPTRVEDNSQAPKKTLIWPSPPEPARVSYVRTIERSGDIGAGKGFFRRISDFLLGEKTEEILRPYGVTADASERLIIADTALKRVHIFDVRAKEYSFIDGPGDSDFNTPIGVATDADENIYLTDSGSGKVYVFGRKGKLKYDFPAGKRPTGIAVNKKEGLVYVTDTELHNLKIFDLKGKPLDTVGKWGTGPGEFNRPVDVFVDKNGDVYVADTMNYRVQILDRKGRFIAKFGKHGDGTGDFGRIKGLAVDNEGNIYVADAIFDTVQIFNRNGGFLLNFGSIGREAGSFWMPTGLFIDSRDKIYVADAFNKRIQVFEYIGG